MTTPSTGYRPLGQEQPYPGRTAEMDPTPRDEMRDYQGRGLLDGARALNTGGDSGIDRAATKGAVLAFTYSLAQALAGPRHQGEELGPRAGLHAADPGHFPRGESGPVRRPGAHGPGRPARRDHPSYVFFASGRLSSYYSGEVLALIGGETLPS